MKYEKTSIPILILFCIFIYPVMFKSSTILSYAYQYGIPLFYIALNINFVKRISKKQLLIISCLVILLFFSVLYPTLHNSGDYTYIKVSSFVFRKLVVYLFLIIVLVKKYKEHTRIEHFMYYYILVHVMFVIGTLLLVLIPNLKYLWFSLFSEVNDSEAFLEAYGYTFRIGWQGFAGYRMTLHCTWCCIFLLYMYYACETRYRLKENIFLIAYAICFLGNMFYGRVGLVLSIVMSLIAVLVWNRKHFLRILQFTIIAVVLIYGIYLLRRQPIISDWYTWMSRPLINLITEGRFNNYSVDRLKEMVFLPEWDTILFGDGFFMQDTHYYERTDSGIMRNILFWGILGAVISYGVTFYSLLDLKKKNFLMWLLMIGTLVVFEYKGDAYYEFIALMFAISFIENAVIERYSGKYKEMLTIRESLGKKRKEIVNG